MSDAVESMKIKAIAPWFGSNRNLARNVGRELGKRAWVGVPFAGGMCEIPHIDARTIVANDLHRHVVNMARVMADPNLGPTFYRKVRRFVMHPDILVVAQQRCEMREQNESESRGLFNNDRDRLRVDAPEPDLLWAIDYFVSVWMSRSHTAGSKDEFSCGMSWRWTANGGDSAVRYHNAALSLPSWRRALRHTSFTTLCALEFLGDKCRDLPGHGIYCDPPFPGPGKRYKHSVDVGFQRALRDQVERFESARVVMRFYDHPLIRELYSDENWTWLQFKGRTQTNGDAPEVLLINGPSYTEASA